MQLRIQGVQKDDALIAKNFGVELGKGCGQSFALAIGGRQQLGYRRSPKQDFQLLKCSSDLLVEGDHTDGRAFRMWWIHAQPFEMVSSRQVHEVDLGQVVILAGQPENRNCSSLLGKLGRGDRFESTKGRPGGKPPVLTGHDRRRAVSQTLNVLESLGPGAEFLVLTLQNVRHHFAAIVWVNDALLLFFPPVPCQRRPGVETANLVKMMEEVVKETAGVRNARKWKTLRIHDSVLRRLHEQIGLNLRRGDAKIPLFLRAVYDPPVYPEDIAADERGETQMNLSCSWPAATSPTGNQRA